MSKEVNQEERTPRTVGDVKEMLTKHSNGEIQRTIQNCITILQNDHVLADAIRLNLLSERIDIVKPVGWPRSGKTLNDTDMKYILRRMEKYSISSEKKIESAIQIVANENRYHPIRDYLNGLKWDGTERIAHILHHVLGIGCASAVVYGSAVNSIAVFLHCQRKYFVSGQLSHSFKLSFTACTGLVEFVFHGGHSPYTRLNAPEDCIAGKFYEKLRTQAVCAHSYAIVYHETAKNKRVAKKFKPEASANAVCSCRLSRENAIADGLRAVCYC